MRNIVVWTFLSTFLFATSAVYGQTASELANERVYQFQQQRIAAMNTEIQQELAAEAADKARRAAIRQRAAAIGATLQNYPWRVVDGITQHVAVTWCVFSGRVLQTSPDGVRVQGQYAPIYQNGNGGDSFLGEFFVRHFPYALADGDSLPPYVAAVPEPVYTYTTVMNAERSIHCLDFGIPCDEPQWAVEYEETNKLVFDSAAEKAKVKGESRALEVNESAAAKGDAFGLLRMGERYRDGDCVAKDLAKARTYLMEACLKGEVEASNELATLPAVTISTNLEVAAQSSNDKVSPK